MKISKLAIILFLGLSTICSAFAESERKYSGKDWYEQGIKYGQQGDLENALKCFQKLIEIEPANASGYINAGKVYGLQRNFNEAIKYLEKAIELDPRFLEAYINLGAIYERMGDYNNAIKYAQKALELNAGHPAAHFNLGFAYLMNGDKESTLKEYHELKRLKQDSWAERLEKCIVRREAELRKGIN